MNLRCKALVLAGAEVLVFNCSDDDQCHFFAKVLYAGDIGWVSGWAKYCPVDDTYLYKLGKIYLRDMFSQEEAEKIASANICARKSREAAINFLKANKI